MLSAYLSAIAKAALIAADVALAGCDQVYSRGDFEAVVRDKSDKEVAANVGKLSHFVRTRRSASRKTRPSPSAKSAQHTPVGVWSLLLLVLAAGIGAAVAMVTRQAGRQLSIQENPFRDAVR